MKIGELHLEDENHQNSWGIIDEIGKSGRVKHTSKMLEIHIFQLFFNDFTNFKLKSYIYTSNANLHETVEIIKFGVSWPRKSE